MLRKENSLIPEMTETEIQKCRVRPTHHKWRGKRFLPPHRIESLCYQSCMKEMP